MNIDETADQAKFIITAGRKINAQILKAQSRRLAAAASVANREMSIAQWHAVRIVRHKGVLAMGELAEGLGISAPSASVMVDRLVEKGLLCRERSAEDRRKVVVRVSPEAVKEIETIEDSLLRLFTRLVEQLGPDTTRKWCEVLAEVKKVLDESETFNKTEE